MLSSLSRFIRPAAQNPYHYLVPQVVEGLGSNVTKVENFEGRLLPAVEQACAYLDQQIARIPGGLYLSQEVFAQNPVLSRLFGEKAAIRAALGRSLEVKSSLPGLTNKDNEVIHALLGMRIRPDAEGKANAGTFTDHTIATLAAGEEDSRKFLRYLAFMRMVNNSASFANGDPEQGIRSVTNRSGEEKLESLLSLLARPATWFRLESSGFRVPAMDAGQNDKAPLVELPLLHCSDRRQWIACFVSFPLAEAADALAQEVHKHRYIYF